MKVPNEEELPNKFILVNHLIQVADKSVLSDAIVEVIESIFELERKATEACDY